MLKETLAWRAQMKCAIAAYSDPSAASAAYRAVSGPALPCCPQKSRSSLSREFRAAPHTPLSTVTDLAARTDVYSLTSNRVDDITFESVRDEAETGKTYRLPPRDKRGRPVLTMRPGRENSTSHEGNVRHLIYHMETMVRPGRKGNRNRRCVPHQSLVSASLALATSSLL